MIVVMNTGCRPEDIARVVKRIEELGFRPHYIQGAGYTIIGAVGKYYPEAKEYLELLPGVKQVIQVATPYKLSSREYHPLNTLIEVGGITIGGSGVVVMAGPCAIENEEQLLTTALEVKSAGAVVLRGGAFKPRTSPYDFQGLGTDGLKILAEVGKQVQMPVVTEVMAPHDVDLVAEYADILQVGARNMQNFILLNEVGRVEKPVLLKRGMSSTIQEWLLAAEYILSRGNEKVILCERGIRTFETYTRNTMDISSIPVAKKLSHLPVIADPSHGSGRWYLVPPLSLAAVVAGADGLLIEVHPNPDLALVDGPQSLNFTNFRLLMSQLVPVAKSIGRSLATSEGYQGLSEN